MSANKNLQNARAKKNDEFYTQLSDIENEMKHYREHFKGKVVYCNCDDPRVSNFFHYFSYNFEYLGLKKLITTCYKSLERDLFSRHDSEKAIYLEYSGFREGERVPDPEDIGIKYLEGNGDFRNEECIELLKQVDIVVTNPPFSLFREYVSQLMEYEKKFVIIGSKSAITYKEIFKFIENNRLWLGHNYSNGSMHFETIENGEKLKRSIGSYWFTNLDIKKRHEDLILYKKYNANDYPKYDNYNAINVDKTKEIPMDYEGAMGVPISFLDKYNPKQFEIIGIDRYVKDNPHYGKRFSLNGIETYARIIIKNKKIIKGE